MYSTAQITFNNTVNTKHIVAFFVVTSLLLLSTIGHAENQSSWQAGEDSLYQHIISKISHDQTNFAATSIEGDNSSTSVLQVGNENISLTLQQGSDQSAKTYQKGKHNESSISQEGETNKATVKQYFNHNDSDISQEGQNLSIYVKQLGYSNLSIEQENNSLYGFGKNIFIIQAPFTDITIKQYR